MTATILPMPSPVQQIKAALKLSVDGVRAKVDACDRWTDALELWQQCRAIEAELAGLSEYAASKVDALTWEP